MESTSLVNPCDDGACILSGKGSCRWHNLLRIGQAILTAVAANLLVGVAGVAAAASITGPAPAVARTSAHEVTWISSALCQDLVTVTSVDDSGAEGTLRWAIDQVCPNGAIQFDRLAFRAPATIALAGQLVITKSMTIRGTGAGNVRVDGVGQTRVFTIAAGADVTMQGLTITGGSGERGGGIYVAGDGSNPGRLTLNAMRVVSNTALHYGGAIFAQGPVTLTHVTLEANRTAASNSYGGAIAMGDGVASLYAQHITVTGNLAIDGEGGGIYFYGDGPMTLTHSLLQGNHSDNGGAIYAQGDSTLVLTVDDSDFISNTALNTGGAIGLYGFVQFAMQGGSLWENVSASAGGAIGVEDYSNRITIADVTFARNRSALYGGAIFAQGPVTLTQVTLDANETIAGSSYGGAIALYHDWAPLLAEHITVTNNAAVDGGGGIYIHGNGPVTIAYSRLQGNRSQEGSAIYAQSDSTLLLTVRSTVLLSNTAGEDGRALYLHGNVMLDMAGGSLRGDTLPGQCEWAVCGPQESRMWCCHPP